MKVKTNVKADGGFVNHNHTHASAPGCKVRSRVKAGGLSYNHNQTLVQSRQAR